MTDRDRLINSARPFANSCACEEETGVCEFTDCKTCNATCLADVLIEDGWIRPPCKVGDKVYQIKYCRCGNPECFEMKHCYKKDTKRTPKVIDSIMISQKGKRLTAPYKFEWKPIGTICYKIIQKPFKLEWLTEIGKTVFLTKEEAEAELRKRGVSNAENN